MVCVPGISSLSDWLNLWSPHTTRFDAIAESIDYMEVDLCSRFARKLNVCFALCFVRVYGGETIEKIVRVSLSDDCANSHNRLSNWHNRLSKTFKATKTVK